MDKLVEHGIRMLEIVEGGNYFFLNDAKRQADIAQAVYDTILRVQALERKADRKTEPQKKEVEWVYNKRERLWYPYSNGELLFNDKPTTQTKTQNSNLTFEKADERCKGCNHYKLTCDLFSEICRYEPKDEPQTERNE